MKEKFIKTTLILLLGNFITKLLAMIIKMMIARKIGSTGLGMYMLILPTFMLVIHLSQFGLPLSLSKLISEKTCNNKHLFLSILPILIGINLIIMISITLLAPIISKEFLHNTNLTISILAMALVIPFTSTSSICRSYFFGKSQMVPHIISNISENVIRFIVIKIGIFYILPLGLEYTTCFLVLSNIISEITSTIILLMFLPKNIKITKKDLKPKKNYIKRNLKISIPNTTNHLLGSIGLFLEPIILTNTLLQNGYKINYITKEYGIITGYILPLILLPSFFTLAISQALLPEISQLAVQNEKKQIQKKIKIAILLSLVIGLPTTIFLEINPTLPLRILYHTKEGINYLRILNPICLLQYIQAPLSSTLEAIGKSKENLYSALIGTISRILILYVSSFFKIGIYCLIISLTCSIILTTNYQIKTIQKYLKI